MRPVLIETHERGEKQPDFDTHLDSAIKSGKTKAQGALFQAASRTLAERWKNMTPAERDPFERQAQEEMKKYKIQLGAFEMRKAAEEKAAKAMNVKAKEVPKQAPPPSESVAGSSSAGTTTRGVRPQQSNLSDSEATTISSKSDPANAQGKIFLQQPLGLFNINNNNSSSDTTSQYPCSESNSPNVIATSDIDSLAKNNNASNQQNDVGSLSRAIASILMNQLTGGNSPNNNQEDMIRRVATAALLESILADPAALLLAIVVLLQANANQATPEATPPPPPPPPPPQADPTASLLASFLQSCIQNPVQEEPPQPATPLPPAPAPAPFPFVNGFNMFQAPSAPTFVQDNTQATNQASLLENLSRLSEGERDVLMKFIQGNGFDFSQSS